MGVLIPAEIFGVESLAPAGIPLTVLLTGRKFGRKTQKWPCKNLSGRKKQRPNFLQIFQKIAEKCPDFFAVCSSHQILDCLQK
jgi:hypothetical protein